MAINVGYDQPRTDLPGAISRGFDMAMNFANLKQRKLEEKNQGERFDKDLALRQAQQANVAAHDIFEETVEFPEKVRQFGIDTELRNAAHDQVDTQLRFGLLDSKASSEAEAKVLADEYIRLLPKAKKIPGGISALEVTTQGKLGQVLEGLTNNTTVLATNAAAQKMDIETAFQQKTKNFLSTQAMEERKQNLAEVGTVLNTFNSMDWNPDQIGKWSTNIVKMSEDRGQPLSPLMQTMVDLGRTYPAYFTTPQQFVSHAMNLLPKERKVEFGAMIADSWGLGPNTPVEKAKQQAIAIFNNATTLSSNGKLDITDPNDPFVQGVIQHSPSGTFDLEGVTNYVLQSQRDGDYGSIGGLIMETMYPGKTQNSQPMKNNEVPNKQATNSKLNLIPRQLDVSNPEDVIVLRKFLSDAKGNVEVAKKAALDKGFTF